MEPECFERHVAEAVSSLPPDLLERIENLEVVVEEVPSVSQLESVGLGPRDTLLGLYEGVPLTARTSHYGMVAPDKITIFRRPIGDGCRSDTEIARRIRQTVYHEIAHHFGISDSRLVELQNDRRSRRRSQGRSHS